MTKSGFRWKQFIKSVAVIAIPVALQNMLTTTGSMVDTMMIGSLGENNVGAVGLCAQFSSLMFSCYWGFVGGGMLFFAQYYGADDDDGIDRSYGITVMCMMIVALIFAILGLAFPSAVMRLYTDKTAIQTVGIQYLRTVALAWPLQVFSMAMSALLRSTGKVRIPLYAAVSSVASNIFLNWVFIYGHLGMPAMGVRGAALATVIAALINVIVCIMLAAHSRYPYLFHFKKHFSWTKVHIREYFIKCFPIICNELLLGIGNACISIVMGRQSEEAIAAIAVFRTLEGLVIAFFAGFSNASSILVGKSVGAGDPELAYQRAKRIVYMCSGTIAAVSVTLFIARAPVLKMMKLSGLSYEYAGQMLLIYMFASVIRMGNWTQNDTFRSGGDSTFGTVLEIVFMYIAVIPSVYISGIVLRAPLFVIFMCCYIDEPIRYVLMQIHLYSCKWIKPVTEQGRNALKTFKRGFGKKTSGKDRTD